MKKLYIVFTCFIISLLSIGQSDSLVIWDKKSGKEFIVNEGENIRVVTKGRDIYKGKLNKIFYDSSLNITILKIDNYTIPYDAVNSMIKSVNYFANNCLYAEAHLGLFTQIVINYERQIQSGKKVSWYGRLGGGYGLFIDDIFWPTAGWGGLGAITMLTGKKNNHFELNAGAFIGNEGYTFIFPIFNIGYRFQKPEGGFIFRANAGFPSLGLSIGYAF